MKYNLTVGISCPLFANVYLDVVYPSQLIIHRVLVEEELVSTKVSKWVRNLTENKTKLCSQFYTHVNIDSPGLTKAIMCDDESGFLRKYENTICESIEKYLAEQIKYAPHIFVSITR
jgi:hypothetical protein